MASYTFFSEHEFERKCPRAMQMKDYAETVSHARNVTFNKASCDKLNEKTFTAIYDYPGHSIKVTCTLSDSPEEPDEYSHEIDPA